MGKKYILLNNLDRTDEHIDFDGEVPPVGVVLQIEDELIWRGSVHSYSRGINGTDRDRYFAGTEARPVGIALVEWEDEKS